MDWPMLIMFGAHGMAWCDEGGDGDGEFKEALQGVVEESLEKLQEEMPLLPVVYACTEEGRCRAWLRALLNRPYTVTEGELRAHMTKPSATSGTTEGGKPAETFEWKVL